MGFTVTSSSRRVVMATLIALAICGGFIRYFAPDPSTLRDIGSLLLVLWLPAVGNLIGYYLRKVPRRPPPAADFAAGSAFAPHLQVQLEVAALPPQLALDPGARQCVLLVARRGFTARVKEPLASTLATPGPFALEVELLHPQVALPHLKPGTGLHVLVGQTGVAKGVVLA